MSKLKYILSTLVLASVIFGTSVVQTQAQTIDDSYNAPGVTTTLIVDEETQDNNAVKYDDVLDARLKSTSLPTSYFNLSTGSYNAYIQYVTRSWLYTSKYFHCNGNGQLYIRWNLHSNTGYSTPAKIGVYDMTIGQMVSITQTPDLSSQGRSGTVIVSGLTSGHNYAVAFTAVQSGIGTDSIGGTASISHY